MFSYNTSFVYMAWDRVTYFPWILEIGNRNAFKLTEKNAFKVELKKATKTSAMPLIMMKFDNRVKIKDITISI